MARIATYVFIDLETTGLPSEEYNKTKITELSMVAAGREHIRIQKTRKGATPRVLHKLTRCFNPGKRITDDSSEITGLDNFLLEHESYFDTTIFDMMNNFLNTLTKPVCLIAHNGLRFDFPILKRQLDMLKVSLPDEIMCADSLDAFRDILEMKKTKVSTQIDDADLAADNFLAMRSVNETTPHQVKTQKRPFDVSNAKRRLEFSEKKFKWSDDSYKLTEVYMRVLGKPAISAHRAESDCMMALEIAVTLSDDFISWVDSETNHRPFTSVCAMTPGVKIGS